jgi:hypothetical protein
MNLPLPSDDDPVVQTVVNGRTYQLHYQGGAPVFARRILPDGTACAWWLLADLEAEAEHWAAAHAAEAFLGRLRLPAVAS